MRRKIAVIISGLMSSGWLAIMAKAIRSLHHQFGVSGIMLILSILIGSCGAIIQMATEADAAAK